MKGLNREENRNLNSWRREHLIRSQKWRLKNIDSNPSCHQFCYHGSKNNLQLPFDKFFWVLTDKEWSILCVCALRVAGDIKEHSLQCCHLDFLNENGWSHCTLSHWTEMSEENLLEKTKQKLDFHEFLNMTYLSLSFWIFSGNWIRMCPQLVPWESYLI